MAVNPDCATCRAHTYCRFVGASECLNYQKETNADRIRAMSDDELAEWINKHDCHTNLYGYDPKDAVLNWLQSPADGGDGNG